MATIHHLPVVKRVQAERLPTLGQTITSGLWAIFVLPCWWALDLLGIPLTRGGYYKAADIIEPSARRQIALWAVVILLAIAATVLIAVYSAQTRWYVGTAIAFCGYLALTFVRLFEEGE